MQADAVDRIAGLARDVETIIQAPDYDEIGRYYLRHADGSYEECFAVMPRPARLYATESLACLLIDSGHDASVFYGPKAIIGVAREASGSRVRNTLWLEKHPAFKRLAELRKTENFNQRALVRFLRAELNGHVDDSVIEQFRSLKLTANATGTSVMAKGRESVDRKVLQEVLAENDADVPDEITVTVPVYDLAECREDLYDVRVLVETGMEDGGSPRFELTAVHNDLMGAEDAALAKLVASLSSSLPSVPLYNGEPT